MKNRDLELIGGEEHRRITIRPYDPKWAARFQLEKSKIREALDVAATKIEHVGSTAVPGLPAKPIIDIQVSVKNLEDEASYIPQLAQTGYQLRVREKGHRMLRPSERDVHVHVCQSDSDWERRHLLFRDWLRVSDRDREAYARLKMELAGQHWKTMNHYVEAKSNLIQQITKRAEKWAKAIKWQP